MPNYTRHDTATSNVLAWTAHAANAVEEDAAADADEPPDQPRQQAAAIHTFEKNYAYRSRDRTESLLTRALQSQSEDEAVEPMPASGLYPRRRRSITSNTSMASTAGFTSDTGITTPPRTNSPSPRLVNIGFAPVNGEVRDAKAAAPSVDTTPKPAASAAVKDNKPESNNASDAPAQAPQRKRCISFACGPLKPSQAAKSVAKPASPPAPVTKTPGPDDTPKAAYAQLAAPAQLTEIPKPVEQQQPKRSCIRFACPARPSADAHKPQLSTLKVDAPENLKLQARRPSPAPVPKSPTAMRKPFLRRDSSNRSPRPVGRSSGSRQSSHSPMATRSKKYYNAEPGALNEESSRFHEFASDVQIEDDWIRRDKATVQQRLTINDTLKKELAIRLLGKEAEEEAEQEEDDEENDDDEEDDEDDLVDEDDDEDDEDDDDDNDENDTVEGDNEYLATDERFSGYSSGGGASDGYNTDNETGFASSDDEDDGLVLWAVNQPGCQRRQHNFDNDHSTLHQAGSPIFRRLSVDEHSDSSGFIAGIAMRQDRPKNRELVNTIRRTGTPELPDSTDFVCGTFDEDRPLEEAYQSHIAARKRGKTHVIPQDIDPSFPTSDPEDNSDDEQNYKQRAHQQKRQQQNKQAHGSADERFWEIEDIQHDQMDRADARQKNQKSKAVSPRRCRSPPPPKARGRSPAPRRLFDRHSPTRRLKSPCPINKAKPMAVPMATPMPVPIIVASSHIPSPPASPVDALDNRGRPMFQALAFKPGLTTTKSLPRPSAIFRHQQRANANAGQTQATKPTRRPKANSLAGAKQPRVHVRGAIDIVKGLEQKRQRRREKFQQKYCNRARKGQVPERRTQRGEGAERMREVGLLMAGKIPQGNYVLSV